MWCFLWLWLSRNGGVDIRWQCAVLMSCGADDPHEQLWDGPLYWQTSSRSSILNLYNPCQRGPCGEGWLPLPLSSCQPSELAPRCVMFPLEALVRVSPLLNRSPYLVWQLSCCKKLIMSHWKHKDQPPFHQLFPLLCSVLHCLRPSLETVMIFR